MIHDGKFLNHYCLHVLMQCEKELKNLDKIKHMKIAELDTKHRNEHTDYCYDKKPFISFGEAKQTLVSVYEIPPLKSAYPYHYHHKNEETFYIISGKGLLKTPDGDKEVQAGDLLFFPANSSGAHKLTNTSTTEKLSYIDFDVVHEVDVSVYPDSGKIGIWGKGINKLYKEDSDVDYYEGE